MFKTSRLFLIIAGLLISLWFVNGQIRTMNAISTTGADLMFKLRPVDPRAFMQGDFMALAYDRGSFPELDKEASSTGIAIVKVDDHGVGTFLRLDGGEALGENEIRINYARDYNGSVTYGGERYFFQEGTAKVYEEADYGVFKVAENGRALLTGLADENRKILKPAPNP